MGNAIELFSLGAIYPSDFLRPDEQPRCEPIELKLMMEDNGLVHLEKTAPKDVMWGKYWYRSGINKTMSYELQDIVTSIERVFKIQEGDIWLDIACNDGTLLSFVSDKCVRVGIDPAEDSYKEEALKHCDFHVQDYFSRINYLKGAPYQRAKIITSIAMFYDLEKPEEFIKDLHGVLEDDGLWVLQLSYSPLMIYQTAFDNILHEHWGYYSLFTLRQLLNKNGFQIMDCQLNDINGGSFRVYAMKDKGNKNLFGTQPYRDVCKFRVNSLLAYESAQEHNNGISWYYFFEQIKKLKKEVVEFITSQKENGKTIWAYGASTKGNTLLQYFGLDNTLIDGIAERNIDKWGLRTIGTNIPIYSESDMRKAKPDFLLILPWHFIQSFIERENELLLSGTKFIVPCPRFEIISL